MPWSAQLLIGRPVHNYDEIRAILAALGCDTAAVPDEELFNLEEWGDTGGGAIRVPQHTLTYAGTPYPVMVLPYREMEDGTEFPVPLTKPYTAAMIGFNLTDRYGPAILDRDHERGHPEPFAVDVTGLADLLAQTRAWWPEAEVLIMDIHY